MLGQDIKNYRPVHWGHHKWIGSTMDTEFTYFDPLDMRFIAEAFIGIRVWKVLRAREKILQSNEEKKSMMRSQLVIAAAILGAIVTGSVVTGHWALTLSWIVGMLTHASISLRWSILTHAQKRLRGRMVTNIFAVASKSFAPIAPLILCSC
jgi:fatty acid desaturase